MDHQTWQIYVETFGLEKLKSTCQHIGEDVQRLRAENKSYHQAKLLIVQALKISADYPDIRKEEIHSVYLNLFNLAWKIAEESDILTIEF